MLSVAAPLPFALLPGVHWDDAYITFRFAANLAAGHGLVFNPGEPSNGFTSALWTLVLSCAAAAGGPQGLPAAAKALGVICHTAAACFTAALVRDRLRRPWIAVLAGLAIGANPLLVLLSVSGMETSLVLALVAFTLWLHARHALRRPVLLGAVLGLAVLARPELALLAIVICFFELGRTAGNAESRRRSWRGELRNLLLCGCVTLAFAGPWAVFNRLRSGDAIPPTRKGKLIGRLPERHGITYPELAALSPGDRIRLALADLQGLFATAEGGILAVPAVLGTGVIALSSLHPALRARLRPQGPALLAAGSFTAVFLGTLVFLFPLPIPRYAAPILPAATAATFVGLGCLLPRTQSRRAGTVAVLAAAGVASAALVPTYRMFVPHAAAQQIRGEIGRWFMVNAPGHAVIALEPIGQIGFVSGLRIVDLGGLVSQEAWPLIVHGYCSDLSGLRELMERRGVTHVVDHPRGTPFSLAPLTEGPEFRLLRAFGTGRRSHLLVFEPLTLRPPRPPPKPGSESRAAYPSFPSALRASSSSGSSSTALR